MADDDGVGVWDARIGAGFTFSQAEDAATAREWAVHAYRAGAQERDRLVGALRDCYECLREGEEFPCAMHPDLWPRIDALLATAERETT